MLAVTSIEITFMSNGSPAADGGGVLTISSIQKSRSWVNRGPRQCPNITISGWKARRSSSPSE
jgi:hypothetical protein